MALTLPSFDEMVRLARTQPAEFEQLRARLCETLISEAPEAIRPRLRGLQFRIDMERRRAKNPMVSCMRLSAMMHESLERLQRALNGDWEVESEWRERPAAEVVSLKKRGADTRSLS